MTDNKRDNEREELWVELTAPSWNLFTRTLLVVSVAGSIFDENNPRIGFYKKLERLNSYDPLVTLESSFHGTTIPEELKSVASQYNELYVRLYLKLFTSSELSELAVDANGEVLDAPELQARMRAGAGV